MAESSNRPKDLFLKALDLPSPPERAAFLAQECGSDEPLRRQIEAMLQAHATPDSFLEKPAVEVGATVDGPVGQEVDALTEPSTGPGTRVGPYKLLQQIGEGGMGVVFMAEQQEPIRRMVALKIIKPGMDSAQVLARFEAERQALALMDHPNIARVLDAGTTTEGRPFFVMELVKGVPITKYCDERRLTPRQRLELFMPICQAVQHAHQKGIIHRDLKPSNVLIALYDGNPVPKVIDFGVAKATGQQLTERTLFTGFGAIVGTLEYMSPEQAELNQIDIDTRSDIYSLGVLLYELLTGSTPIDRKRLKDGALLEVLRMIREEEPPKPSTRLSTSDTLPALSEQRQTEPAKLTQMLRGDIDWIVMKALEKDRIRRYETANGLAHDIERFLQDEPILARPPSTTYRLGKFARKHRALLGSAAAILLLLVVGITVSTILAIQASRAEQDAKIQRDQATKDRDAVIATSAKLQKTQQDLQRSHYLSDMSLASIAWQANHLDHLGELLKRHEPQPGANDMRNFEWHYWQRLLNDELQAFTVPLAVNKVVWSSDGKRLACLSEHPGDRFLEFGLGLNIFILDADTGRLLRRIKTPLIFSPGRTFSLSPCGKRVLCLENDEVYVWDVDTGKNLYTLEMPKGSGPFCQAVFSPDGQHLASISYPKKETLVKIWQADTGKLVRSWRLPDATVDGAQRVDELYRVLPESYRLAFSPDSKEVIVAGYQSPLDKPTIWNVQTGKEIRTLEFASKDIFDVAWLPSGQFAFFSKAGNVHFLDAASGKEKQKISTGPRAHNDLSCMTFSSTGKLLCLDCDSACKVWETQTGKLVRTVRDARGGSLNPDGTRLVAAVLGEPDNQIKIWDARRDPDFSVRTLEGPEKEATDLLASRKVNPRNSPFYSYQQLLSRDGKLLAYSLDSDSGITPRCSVWNAGTGQAVFSCPGFAWAFSPDADLLVTQFFDKKSWTSKLWDLRNNQELTHLPRSFQMCAFSGDGKSVVGFDENNVKVLETSSGAELAHLPMKIDLLPVEPGGPTIPANPLMLSHDGQYIARRRVGKLPRRDEEEMEEAIEVYEAKTAKLLWQTGAVPSSGQQFHFSPDGKYLIRSVSQGGTLHLHEVRSGKEARVLKGHLGRVLGMAFSSDGSRLATSANDHTVKLWDLASSREILSFKDKEYRNIAWHSDGLQLIGLSDFALQFEICTWDARPRQFGKH